MHGKLLEGDPKLEQALRIGEASGFQDVIAQASIPDYSSTRKIDQRRDFGLEDDPQTSRIPGASRS
jgi:hypothetical protein